VAPNALSISQAYFEKRAWFRAIYDDDTPVGFVMLYIDAEKFEYSLWRFMIDHRYQKKNIGLNAMKLVIDYVRTLPNATQLRLSYVPGDGDPSMFYAKLGFIETGEWEDDEKIMVLKL
jgi:diamine N-acetyltransferase